MFKLQGDPDVNLQPTCSEVAGGTSMLHRLQEALVAGSGIDRLVWVDAFGYDSFPALACLEAGL